MKILFSDIINIPKLQKMLEKLYEASSIATGVMDVNGEIYATAGWLNICTKFNRQFEKTLAKCEKCRFEISDKIKTGEKFVIHRCENGPFHCVIPLIIEGVHHANIFHGQFFLDKPDLDFFAKYAEENGFEKDGYMRSIIETPVLTIDTVKKNLELLQNLGELLTELGMGRLMAIRQNEEMRSLKIYAEAANIAKSQFLANISHEIRTPLNNVIGFADLLTRTGLNKDQREMTQFIKISGKNLLGLINDVFDFSRIEAGNLEIEKKAFDISNIAAHAVKYASVIAAQKGVNISTSIDPGIRCRFIGDEKRLLQVISHLVNNAVKFTEHGNVALKIKLETETEKNSGLNISVSDSGVGIEASDIKKIFTPFTQADGAGIRKYGGAGFGLTLAQSLVKLMGAEGIFVESAPDAGSVFHFRIELEKGELIGGMPEKKGAAETGEKPRLKILIAEDNLINLKLMMELLKMLGHEVIPAENGKSAFDIFKKEKIDLIFMDLQMPIMDGLEATSRIRAANDKIPVIAMTAFANREDYEQCMKCGMNDYISKPINTNKLEEIIARCLKKNEAQPDPAACEKRPLEFKSQADENGQPATFNREKFMKTVLGKQELAKEIIRIFFNDFETFSKEIKTAAAAGNSEIMRKAAHRLKGSSLNVAAERLNLLFASIEVIGKANKTDGVEEILEKINIEYSGYRAEIEKLKF